MQSTDNACFAWSVVATLHPAKNNTNQVFSYPHYTSVLNLEDIEFPMTLTQIKKFENLKISINVYASRRKRNSRSFRFGSLIQRETSMLICYMCRTMIMMWDISRG